MVQFNQGRGELACKLVYFGPAGSGKTTSLRALMSEVPPERCSNLTEVVPDDDARLAYEHVELKLGKFAGLRTRLLVTSAPFCAGNGTLMNELWNGVDGVVFVADSAPDRLPDNVRALERLHEVLGGPSVQTANHRRRTVPILFQWNKADLEEALTPKALAARLNPRGRCPSLVTNALEGEGTLKALKQAATIALESLEKVYGIGEGEPRPRYTSTTRRLPRVEDERQPAPAPASASSGAVVIQGVRPPRANWLRRLFSL